MQFGLSIAIFAWYWDSLRMGLVAWPWPTCCSWQSSDCCGPCAHVFFNIRKCDSSLVSEVPRKMNTFLK
jgi:hypothetical protein